MTGTALCVMVFPEQGEFGFLVMIEQDFLPALIIVATLALGAKIALVLVVFLVARVTIHLQLVFIQITFVARYTLGVMMFSSQRKFGFLVMIKNDFLPAAFHMAVCALGSKVALVLVVFLMA